LSRSDARNPSRESFPRNIGLGIARTTRYLLSGNLTRHRQLFLKTTGLSIRRYV
jgi:hypothetical protein